MSLKCGHVHPGDCISANHYISLVPGHLPHTFGREKHGYTCGSLFVEHPSRKIFNFCQYSTNANETIKSAQRLESMARQENIEVKKYHLDNGFFATTAFKTHCESQQQEFSFSSVGAHHQNGVAKRNIKSVAQWACANMLHLALHWPAQANISFGLKQSNTQCGCLIECQMQKLASLQMKYGRPFNALWRSFQELMFFDAQFTFLTLLSKMVTKYQNGAHALVSAYFLDFLTFTLFKFC
jgi:hypothetical protein